MASGKGKNVAGVKGLNWMDPLHIMHSGKGGNSNQSQANKAQKNAIGALTPQTYSDPYGTLGNGQFRPANNPQLQQGMGNFDSAIAGLSGQLNKPFDINSYYNNPFYQSTADQLKAPIDRQYTQDQAQMSNDLNARNQIGSSYDALMHRNLDQQHDYNLSQADLQAHGMSADAYNQQYQNLMAGLNTALQGRGQAMDQVYAPAKLALGYQGAMNPLQTGAANIYGNAMQTYLGRPTATDRFIQYLNATSGNAGAIAKAV